MLIGTDKVNGKGGWEFFEFTRRGVNVPLKFDTLEDAKKAKRLIPFKEYIHYEANTAQDAKAIAQARSWVGTEYDVGDHNCGIFACSAAKAGGVSLPNIPTWTDPANWWPGVVKSAEKNPHVVDHGFWPTTSTMGLRSTQKYDKKVGPPIRVAPSVRPTPPTPPTNSNPKKIPTDWNPNSPKGPKIPRPERT